MTVLAVLLSGMALPAQAETAEGECTASTRLDRAVPALQVLQSDLAWSVTRGAGVTVAVVDSGVAASNPHLSGAVIGGANLVPDGTDAAGFTDLYGHGTAIAGQIAAREIAGSGVVGLAPEARILSVRVFAGIEDQQREAGIGPSVARLAEGIRFAADQGAQVINVSLSANAADPAVTAAVAYATERGSLVVASAGNRDSTLSVEEDDQDGTRYPAGDPGALGVGAGDLDGVVGDWSIHGPHVAVTAPGQVVLTTSAVGGDCIYAAEVPATSYAAGYVSAAAALVAAAHPDETPAQWAYRLEATAVRADPDARTDASGWGVVQPYDAIMLAPGTGLRGPASPFLDGAQTPPLVSDAAPVTVSSDPPANAAAVAWATASAVGGLVLLGAVGALGVLMARRRAGIGTAVGDHPGGGLYGDTTRID
ncbi:MAG: S8 family serine peptidase [Microbacterium sp.]|uniref:S8 family serine peptidase n=1 Tax=Microbacterium sp. TaxID=51671 RepID=UPI002625844F|nr:S8 family serine peptidase [Microbacterium sp.]MCX6502531.1 S8 family serine peptidase [Microbacterium sp.]